jgi:hypothetical protein
MGAAGRDKTLARHTWPQVVGRAEALYMRAASAG